MKSKPPLLVMAHSEHWSAAISRHFQNVNRSWVLSLSELADESLKQPGAAAVVELPTPGTADFCVQLSQLSNNSSQLKVFVIGGADLLHWQPLLRAAGVASWHWSFLQIPALVRVVARHHQSVRNVSQSTETGVWQDLPWPGAASARQA